MFCPNCGAEFDEAEPKCPYCGTLNPRGAQNEYMRKLRKLRDETGQLAEEAEDAVHRQTRANSRTLIRVLLILLAAAAVIFGIYKIIESRNDKKALERLREESAFADKYFPEMNALYEDGKDEELAAFVRTLWEEPGYSAVYSWAHYTYLEMYDVYDRVLYANEDIADGGGSIEACTSLVYNAFYLTRDADVQARLTAAEKEKLAGPRAEAEEILEAVLEMNQAEADALYESMLDEYRILNYDRLKKEITGRMKKLGKVS